MTAPDGHPPGWPRWAAPAGLAVGAVAGLVALLNGLPDLFQRTIPWLGSTVMIAGASVPMWLLIAIVAGVAALALVTFGVRSSRRGAVPSAGGEGPAAPVRSAPAPEPASIAAPRATPLPPPPRPVPISPVPPLRGVVGEGEQLLWDVARQRGTDAATNERVRDWLVRAGDTAEHAAPGVRLEIMRAAALPPAKHPGYSFVTEYSFRSPDGGITSEAANRALRAPMENDHGGGLRLGVPEVVEGPLGPGHNVRIRMPFNDKPADTRSRKRLDLGRLPYLDPNLDVMRRVLELLRRLDRG